MYLQEAREEYQLALKAGLKEYKELLSREQEPHPTVLDAILSPEQSDRYVDVGILDIPTERIVGTKTAGRITAFTPSFLPLLELGSEFSAKWVELCRAHLSEGIRDPILCYEYLGNFYVQEGNKRLSVLRHFGAPQITAQVRRVLPAPSDSPEVRAYQEFLEFFKGARLYDIQYRTPGQYEKLLRALGKEFGEPWPQWTRRTFRAYLQYFREAFAATAGSRAEIGWEEALLLWLEVYSFRDIGRLSSEELKKVLSALWEDLQAIAEEEPVDVSTGPQTEGTTLGSLLSRLITVTPEHVHVAFVHPMDPHTSAWVKGHDVGREHLEATLGDLVQVRSYFHADSPEEADRLLDLAVEEGAELVFTTTPQLARATTRAAIRYPRVRFLNCSVDVPYSAIRSYYIRMHEAKFITGAIAGAMAHDDCIGYIGAYPIYGVAACINAFALGAQMTNPRAKILLRWSCLPGNPSEEFYTRGCQVISNREVPVRDQAFSEFGAYGTYFVDGQRHLTPLASPIWLWGSFYEKVVRDLLEGRWKEHHKPLNYWWGMDSGVIDVELSRQLPESMQYLANLLRQGLQTGAIDPFARRILAQDGSVKNDGTQVFTPEELLRMDWLCENVEGFIPEFEQVQPFARNMVRELGLHRDRIPREKEAEAL